MFSPRRRRRPAIDAATAANGGAGVLFMYGNYAGDVMNFDMASEMLGMDGIEARTVLTTDDIASAPHGQAREAARRRRQRVHLQGGGRGGATGCCRWPKCERIARHANARTYTLGVALGALLAAADASAEL